LLASNESYTNQAFRVGPRAWGLQFHLEVTVEAVTRFVETFKGDPAIAEQASRHLAILEPARDLVLERFARLV
jgi:GMP synthase-like glutamine amidotransferase